MALDFFEHIYEDDLSFVISELFRVAKRYVFLQIATIERIREVGFILHKEEPVPWDDGRTWAGHVTVQDGAFWHDRFDHEDWMLRRDMVHHFCSLVDPGILHNWLLSTIITLEKI